MVTYGTQNYNIKYIQLNSPYKSGFIQFCDENNGLLLSPLCITRGLGLWRMQGKGLGYGQEPILSGSVILHIFDKWGSISTRNIQIKVMDQHNGCVGVRFTSTDKLNMFLAWNNVYKSLQYLQKLEYKEDFNVYLLFNGVVGIKESWIQSILGITECEIATTNADTSRSQSRILVQFISKVFLIKFLLSNKGKFIITNRCPSDDDKKIKVYNIEYEKIRLPRIVQEQYDAKLRIMEDLRKKPNREIT